MSDFLPSSRMIKRIQKKSYCLAAVQAPAMPVVTGYINEHRPRISLMPPLYNACVARSLTMKEMTSHAAGRAAQDSEWSRLRKAGAWNESGVREWSQVSAEAKRSGRKHHVGRVFEVNVEKGSELPVGHPGRKFKCRVVFQGSNVRDEHNQWALFQDLSSCPATMQAAKAADVIGLFEGNDVQQADAEQAYIQAYLGSDTPTWIRLPREQWPAAWKGMQDPVCPLVLALYGHPESGGWWEKHSHEQLKSVGFEEIPNWRSCFYHKRLKLFLIVYVDDFKLAGPKQNLTEGWKLIRSKIKTEDPTKIDKFLGCQHTIVEKFIKEGENRLSEWGAIFHQSKTPPINIKRPKE